MLIRSRIQTKDSLSIDLSSCRTRSKSFEIFLAERLVKSSLKEEERKEYGKEKERVRRLGGEVGSFN